MRNRRSRIPGPRRRSRLRVARRANSVEIKIATGEPCGRIDNAQRYLVAKDSNFRHVEPWAPGPRRAVRQGSGAVRVLTWDEYFNRPASEFM